MADPLSMMEEAMVLGEMAEAAAPLLGRATGAVATALERAGPTLVSAGVAAAAYAAKRPFGVFSGFSPETPGKAGKKLRRLIHEGFEPKKLFRDLENSLLPAHKRPRRETLPSDMPGRAAKRPGRVGKRTTKRRIAKSGPTGKRKRTTNKNKKLTKSKKKSGVKKNVSVSYETHGLIQRDHVSYFGFQSTGGLDELFKIACEGVMRGLLRKFKIQIRSPDETLQIAQSVPSVDKFQIYSRQRDYSDGSDNGTQNDVIDLNGATYATVVTQFADAMKTRAIAGYFPYYMVAYNNGVVGGANEVMRDAKFGQAKVTLGSIVKLKMRNITPNDGDGTDRFALDTNPLQGRLYKFAGDVPRMREGLYETEPTVYAKFHDRQATSGLCWGPQRASAGDHDGVPDAAANIMGDGKLMSSPVANGKTIWSNCVSSHPVLMQPGTAMLHTLKFTFNGTFVKFLQKYNVNQYTLPNIGTAHWLGLEQMYKQKKKAASGEHASDGHDHVVIEYDIDTKVSAGCAFAAAERAPRQVITVAAHNSAPTS
ncbi:MAG: capsid protein [Cressdnaviricota sp.]|nr:MAG: capsid protein [Cressdnaviricota sp.]